MSPISNKGKGTLVYLSGMSLGQEFLGIERLGEWEVVMPVWLEPEENEPLTAYARRMARTIKPWNPTYLAGVSFGGALVLEMIREMKVKGACIVAGITNRAELPWYFRIMRFVPAAVLRGLIDVAYFLATFINRWLGFLLSENAKAFFKFFKKTKPSYVKWGIHALLNWTPNSAKVEIPVLRIHGNRDRIFKPLQYGPIAFVEGGGHALTATHSGEVNGLIYEFIWKHTQQKSR